METSSGMKKFVKKLKVSSRTNKPSNEEKEILLTNTGKKPSNKSGNNLGKKFDNILESKMDNKIDNKLDTLSLHTMRSGIDNIPLFTLKADEEIDYKENESDPDYEPPLKEVTGIQFTFLSAKEIENMAVVRVTQPKLSGEGSVGDPRMGTITNYQKCVTCGLDWKACNGHPGYIKMPPIPHPIRLKQIADVLSGFCQFCHRPVLSKSQMKVLQIFKYRGEHRFNAYLSIAKKTVRCHHCKKPHGKYIIVEDKFMKCYKKKSEIKKIPIFYDEVVDIIYNIREKDYKLLGYTNDYSHPSNMIISNLVVLPPCVIPYVESGGLVCEDDLKYKLIDICKKALTLQNINSANDEKEKSDTMDSLFFHVKTLMDNSKNKARDMQNKRAVRSLKQRMTSKSGLIRQNIQAKRSDLTARSVISPDPDLHVNEVAIPEEIAKKVSYPEEVNNFNIKRCQQLLEEGKVSRIIRGGVGMDARFALYTRGFKLQYGDQVIRNGKILPTDENFQIQHGDDVLRREIIQNDDGTCTIKKKLIKNVEPSKRKQFQLKIGDIVERDRQKGDYTIFNRQPTLWGPGLRAKKMVIRKGIKTFQFELSSSSGYNAD